MLLKSTPALIPQLTRDSPIVDVGRGSADCAIVWPTAKAVKADKNKIFFFIVSV
jgi:hypothetical protein